MRNAISYDLPGNPNIVGAARTPTPRPSDIAASFLNAIKTGDLPGVHHLALQHQWLLETDLGASPILLALRHRRRAVANVLAFLGMKLNILEAAALGNERRVREWAGFHAATVHQRDAHGWTALHHASFYGHLSVVKALLDAGADANALVPGTVTRAIDLASNPKVIAKLKSASSKGSAAA